MKTVRHITRGGLPPHRTLEVCNAQLGRRVSLRWLSVVDQISLPGMLAYSGALQGRIDQQQEWWMRRGKDKRPNVHMQRRSSTCGVPGIIATYG